MSREQLELLVNDDSLQVPFGIVELQLTDGQSVDLHHQPPFLGVPDNLRHLVDRCAWALLPNEWISLVFFYTSLIPFELPKGTDAVSTPESWQGILDRARAASPDRPIANVLIFDGLPATADCYPRLISLAAHRALQDLMRYPVRQLPGVPYERFNQEPAPKTRQPTSKPLPAKLKLLVVISPHPERAWDQIQKIKTQLSFVPEFFDELRPSNQEMVAEITYLQVDNSSGKPICRTRSLSPDQSQVLTEALVHIDTSIPWEAMAYGDNLANAIRNANDLYTALPAKRTWPATCPEFPHNWLHRELDDDMPPYPGEPDVTIAEYPKGPERLLLDRWLFWSWQSGRWKWSDIYGAAGKFGQLANVRGDAGTKPDRARPDQARTAKKRATQYATWIGYELRAGKQTSQDRSRSN